MRIDYNPKAMRYEFYPDSADEYYTLKTVYDNQNRINTDYIGTELIKRLFKFTIEGREVTADQFISYYNSRINKAENNKRKFITVHKYDNPEIKASIFIDQIQAITERDNGYASIRLRGCNYDTCDKYDKIIKQLS